MKKIAQCLTFLIFAAIRLQAEGNPLEQSLQAVLQAQVDYFRSLAAFSPLPGADFQVNQQSLFYATGLDYAPCNGIVEKDLSRPLTNEEIDDAIRFFSSKNLPFIWWSSAKILESKNFQFGGILTGVALDLSKELPTQQEPVHIKIKKVESIKDLQAFTSLAAVFALTPKATQQWLDLNIALLQKNKQINFLAFYHEIPVGTVTLATEGPYVSIWNLVTLAEYRKRGIGTALVQAALQEAKSLKCDHAMAILMPKGMASGIFAKLGFKDVIEFPFYVYGACSEELEKN